MTRGVPSVGVARFAFWPRGNAAVRASMPSAPDTSRDAVVPPNETGQRHRRYRATPADQSATNAPAQSSCPVSPPSNTRAMATPMRSVAAPTSRSPRWTYRPGQSCSLHGIIEACRSRHQVCFPASFRAGLPIGSVVPWNYLASRCGRPTAGNECAGPHSPMPLSVGTATSSW